MLLCYMYLFKLASPADKVTNVGLGILTVKVYQMKNKSSVQNNVFLSSVNLLWISFTG
jgi:hypothetical protein